MSKTYKVHKYFDLDDITIEQPCTCKPPSSNVTIFSNITYASQSNLTVLDNYNNTMGGGVFSANDITWDELKKSQCIA